MSVIFNISMGNTVTAHRRAALTRRALLASAACALAAPAIAQTCQPEFDLVIRNGTVIDPSVALHAASDVGIKSGLIASIEASISPTRTATNYDAGGRLVTPGLVNFHTHIGDGINPLAVNPNDLFAQEATTTVVSAGDVGPSSVTAFRAAHAATRPRVYAFVMVSRAGFTPFPASEIPSMDYVNVPELVAALVANADILLGVKVRMSYQIVGTLDLAPLQAAIDACNQAKAQNGVLYRVMVHIGALRTPDLMTSILQTLRPGDIITHAYAGSANQNSQATGLAQSLQCIPAAAAAKQRGVLFDIAAGGSPNGKPQIGGSFDYLTAAICEASGFRVDTISSDAYKNPLIGGRRSLLETMSDMLALNTPANITPAIAVSAPNPLLTIDDVIRMTTVTPASFIGRVTKGGTLQVGAPADVAILRLVGGAFVFNDALGHSITATQKLVADNAFVAGAPAV